MVIIALPEMNFKYLFTFTWPWWDDVTGICLIRLSWFNSSRCTYMPGPVVIGFMELNKSTPVSILSWILQKRLNQLPQFVKLRDFQNQEYQYPEKFESKEFRKLQASCFTKNPINNTLSWICSYFPLLPSLTC